MPHIHAAAASLNQTPLDWDKNFDHICQATQAAIAADCELLVCPELSIPGYGCEDMFFAKWVADTAWSKLDALVQKKFPITLIIGLPVFYENKCYNCAAVIHHGELTGVVPKQHLANDGIHYEHRWFTPWKGGVSAVSVLGSAEVPFGELLFNLNDTECLFGIEICEDAWVEDRPAHKMLSAGAQLICNISGSHFAIGKLSERIKIARSLQSTSQVSYIYSNLLGNEAGRAIYDGSSFIYSNSLKLSKRFSLRDVEIVSDILELQATNEKDIVSYKKIPLSSPTSPSTTQPIPLGDVWKFEDSQDLDFHEFTYAVAVGMYDYLRKSASGSMVVSLSGGADSAACAALAKIALDLAITDRGESSVKKDLRKENLHTNEYLYCIYQKTKNNSDITLEAARATAEGLGASFTVVEIDDIVDLYTSKVEKISGRQLSWDQDEIALQNIQARVRGPLVWFLANINRALLIATSNRSEAAVGYTTMDGDTCGGISPIGGISKQFLLRWLAWLKDNKEYGDFSFLDSVTKQTPTAELRPSEQNQTDEAELMPYPVLDFIEKAYIRDKLSPNSIIEELSKSSFPYNEAQYIAWLNRFLSLWSINQWKRERYAPSFHLDDASLDPKTWCRFPILSGKQSIE